jgi:septal ring-binding cell division protein DamX
MQEHAREAPASSPLAKSDDARPAPAVAPAAPPAVAQTARVPATAPARRGGSTGRTALTSDPGIASALQQLDQGDAAGAARQFESFILSGNPNRFTLQVMIACQEDTVKGARTRAGADDSLFILPYSLKGRSCYRVCWGVYADVDSARAAASGVPAALTGSTVPLVVPLSRLRTPG